MSQIQNLQKKLLHKSLKMINSSLSNKNSLILNKIIKKKPMEKHQKSQPQNRRKLLLKQIAEYQKLLQIRKNLLIQKL